MVSKHAKRYLKSQCEIQFYTIQLQRNVDVKLDSLFYIAGGNVNWYNHFGGAKGLALSRLKVSTY